MQELHIPAYLVAIKAHALANYEKDGWDYVVETFEDAEIVATVKNCRTIDGAIRAMLKRIKPLASYRAEIQSTAF